MKKISILLSIIVMLFMISTCGADGQSLTAIAKLAPDAAMGEALAVHYSGGSSLSDDVADWLQENGITE